MTQISVVVGYKDWGLDRLVGAVRSISESLAGLDGEIIVSDFGSIDSTGYREAIESEGARYIRTETDGVWSRSRALNAGLRVASGEIVATTDADMVFTPGTFKRVVSDMTNDPNQFVVMQCHDLPEGIDHSSIESGHYSWEQLVSLSTLRPRWGMGGMIAVPRHAFVACRGLDERMEIYGGEDIDFARRMRRVGLRLHWLNSPEARMFHIWHPPSKPIADETPRGRRAIAANREIQLKDATAARNLTGWKFAPSDREPLVSVVISTHNRSAFLRSAILSVLAQSVSDFELIVVDDGSNDDSGAVVAALNDPRIRYIRQDNLGLAAARNRATHMARGRYIAVMDDDDIMLPRRLEHSLKALKNGANGAYGGWVDFDESSGERNYRSGKRFSFESLLFNSQVYLHPTLMVEAQWLRAIPYDETLRSGSDYNLAVRLARNGVRLTHTGTYLLMRRIHDGRITSTDSINQVVAGALSGNWGRSGMSEVQIEKARVGRSDKDSVVVPQQSVVAGQTLEYLPDRFVERVANVRLALDAAVRVSTSSSLERASRVRRLRTVSGEEVLADFTVPDVSLDQLLLLQSDPSVDVVVRSSWRGDTDDGVAIESERDETVEAQIDADYLVEEALGWLRLREYGMFEGDVLVVEGETEAVRGALECLGEPSEQFLRMSNSALPSFGLVAVPGGNSHMVAVDLWRRVERWEVKVSVLSTSGVAQ